MVLHGLLSGCFSQRKLIEDRSYLHDSIERHACTFSSQENISPSFISVQAELPVERHAYTFLSQETVSPCFIGVLAEAPVKLFD